MIRFALAILFLPCALFCACAATPTQQRAGADSTAAARPESPSKPDYVHPDHLKRLQVAADEWHTETRLERLGVDTEGHRFISPRIDRVDLLRIEIVPLDNSKGVTLESFDVRYVYGSEARAYRCIALRVAQDSQIERVGEVPLERVEPPVARTSYGLTAKVRIPIPQRVVAAAVGLASGKRLESIELRWEYTSAVRMSIAVGGGWFGWRVHTDVPYDSGFVLPASLGDTGAAFG